MYNNFTINIIFIGVQLVVRHIHDGVELNPIDINHNNKFDFQQINYVPLVNILPVSLL